MKYVFMFLNFLAADRVFAGPDCIPVIKREMASIAKFNKAKFFMGEGEYASKIDGQVGTAIFTFTGQDGKNYSGFVTVDLKDCKILVSGAASPQVRTEVN